MNEGRCDETLKVRVGESTCFTYTGLNDKTNQKYLEIKMRSTRNDKMEEDTSSIFGLVRRSGAFTTVIPTFVLVSRMKLTQQYRDNGHFLNGVSSSRRETMVGDSLTRVSVFRVIDIWVGTWVRGFRCGVSDFCFSFKNAPRDTVPWSCPLPQCNVFFTT
jgi:hypothetical protein